MTIIIFVYSQNKNKYNMNPDMAYATIWSNASKIENDFVISIKPQDSEAPFWSKNSFEAGIYFTITISKSECFQ